MTKAERIEELKEIQEDYGCSHRDALLEMLFRFYNSAFPEDALEEEFNAMTDDELLELYLNF